MVKRTEEVPHNADNFFNLFEEYSANAETDDRFVIWTALSILSAIAGRQIYVQTVIGQIFLNIYVMLVSSPAVGKSQIMDLGENLLTTLNGELFGKKLPPIGLGDDNMTPESFVDTIAKNLTVEKISGEESLYSQLVVFKSEISQLLAGGYDPKLMTLLTKFFDAPEAYSESRRTLAKKVIPRPIVSLMAGIQPDMIRLIFPEIAWGQGFMTRVILVHGDSGRNLPLFHDKMQEDFAKRQVLRRKLIKWLLKMREFNGILPFTEDAQRLLMHLKETRMPPEPTHPKLKHYLSRRLLHLMKLSGLFALGNNQRNISEVSVNQAHALILQNEKNMSKVFLGTEQGTDENLLFSLSEYVSQGKNGRRMRSEVMQFLASKTASNRINYVLTAAVQANYIRFEKDAFVCS